MKLRFAARIILTAVSSTVLFSLPARATWDLNDDYARADLKVGSTPGRTVATRSGDLSPSFVLSTPPDAELTYGLIAARPTAGKGVIHTIDALALRTAPGSSGSGSLSSQFLSSAYTSDNEFTPFTFNTGIGAAIRGRITGGAAGPHFARLTLTDHNDIADQEFNEYSWDDGPIEIATDFTDGPATFARGDSAAAFRFLNPERTEFEAFALTLGPNRRLPSFRGLTLETRLLVEAGPGVEIESTPIPIGFRMPTIGAIAAAPIPEPATLALLGFGLPMLALRRRA